MLNGGSGEEFNNPLQGAFLTSIFLQEKQIRYLETLIYAYSASNQDANKINDLLSEYKKMAFPWDASEEKFIDRANRAMKSWRKKKLFITPTERGLSLVEK